MTNPTATKHTLDRTNKVINTAEMILKDIMEKTDSSVMQAYLCDIALHLDLIREVHNQEVNCHDELVARLQDMIQFIEGYVTFDDEFEHEFPGFADSLEEAKQALLKCGVK